MTLSNEHTRIVSVKFYFVKINLPLAVIGIKLSPQMDVTLAFVSSSQGTLGTGCIGGMGPACGVAPGTRSLRSTERNSIDRAIHSLVCCSTREAWRRDALLPRVRSFIIAINALSH